MNKKLLTIAITAALVAPTAVLAEVTVYGQVNMSLDYTNSGRSDVVTKITGTQTAERKSNLDVSSNSSRLGFKGSEDLGGGMKAVWQVESLIGADEAPGTSNALGGRNTFLGLAGGFGTALMGKHDTPFKMFGRSLDPFADSIADTRQLLGNTGSFSATKTQNDAAAVAVAAAAAGTIPDANAAKLAVASANASGMGFDLRAPNVIAYITPNFSGFGAVVAYVSGIQANSLGADENTLSAVSMNATYTNGPIYAGLAYERHGVKELGARPQAKDPSAWRLGGSYAFGPAKVGAMYEQLKNININAAVADVDTKRSGATMFGTYSFGMETVKLAYTMANKLKQPSAVGGEVAGSNANLLALGIDHNFSKRTTAYAQYTKLTNKNGDGTAAKLGAAAYTLGGGGGSGDAVTPAGGDDPSAISVGMIHKF